MNRTAVRYAIALLAPVAAFTIVGCSKEKPAQPTDSVSMVQTKNGVMYVDTIKAQAIITAVDAKKRTVTVQGPNGTKTYKCGPMVTNFNKMAPGDKVNVTLTQEIALNVTAGSAPSVAEGAVVAVSPKGATPAVSYADMAQVTVKVLAIDAENRTVTIEGPQFQKRTLKVGNDARLDKLKVGDDVTIQYAQSVAIDVTK